MGTKARSPFTIEEGGHAPAFALRDAGGTTHTLADYSGKHVIVYFYPRDETPGCTKEACGFRDSWEEFRTRGMVVLGVNYDNIQPPKLNDVIERMDIDFPVLLSDPHLRFGYDRAEQLPMTVLINPQREVHDVLIGPQTAASITAALN